MTEPLLQMERAFFERLALVRSGGDSIRRSMATSSFYAAVEAAKTKKNGGSNRTAVKKVLLRTESHLPRGGFFLFCRRADHRGYKNRADNLRGFPSVLSALRLSVWLLDDGQIQLEMVRLALVSVRLLFVSTQFPSVPPAMPSLPEILLISSSCLPLLVCVSARMVRSNSMLI